MKKLGILVLMFALIGLSTSVLAQDFVVFKIEDNANVRFGRNSVISEDLRFVVTGPLVNKDGSPVGGYVDMYKQIQPWVKPNPGTNENFDENNGIFGLSRNAGMILIPYEEWDDSYALIWGFQNGRILVQDGINSHNPKSHNRYYRAGIGFRADDVLIVVVSSNKVTYWELANKILEEKCTNAIYLDGFGSLTSYVGYATEFETVGLNPNAIKLQFFHTKIKKRGK